MAHDLCDNAIEGLKQLLSEKSDFEAVAYTKIKQLTLDLEADSAKEVFPIEKIKNGFTHFKIEKYDKNPDLFGELSKGQSPKVMSLLSLHLMMHISAKNLYAVHGFFLLGFSSLSITYSRFPGEAFMVRNITSMVPPYDKIKYSVVGAAIEYAVLHLKNLCLWVKLWSSGGVHFSNQTQLLWGGLKGPCLSRTMGVHLLQVTELSTILYMTSDFIEDWVKICSTAKSKVQAEFKDLNFAEQCTKCEMEAVNVSLGNLLSYPFVKAAVMNKTLSLK
ncbi:carbonic anhydrase 2-like protein [Tanacetum coccineum]